MNGATLRTIREGLGVTAEWLADFCGVQLRSVQRWEAGDRRVPAGVAEAVETLRAQQDSEVAQQLRALRGVPSPRMLASSGWQRAVAFRVITELPDLVVDDD